MTSTESRYFERADHIRAIYEQCPDGIDSDFDDALADLEHQLAEFHFALANP